MDLHDPDYQPWPTVTSLYFDSKEDATLTHQKIGGKFCYH